MQQNGFSFGLKCSQGTKNIPQDFVADILAFRDSEWEWEINQEWEWEGNCDCVTFTTVLFRSNCFARMKVFNILTRLVNPKNVISYNFVPGS